MSWNHSPEAGWIQAERANLFVPCEMLCNVELRFHQHRLALPLLLGGIPSPTRSVRPGNAAPSLPAHPRADSPLLCSLPQGRISPKQFMLLLHGPTREPYASRSCTHQLPWRAQRDPRQLQFNQQPQRIHEETQGTGQ